MFGRILKCLVAACIAVIFSMTMVQAVSLPAGVSGRILLQVQAHGEAWYVNPVDGKRYYMKDGDAALAILRKFGLGISNRDFAAVESKGKAMPNRLKGRILIKVQDSGKAYYVLPKDGSLHYMKNGVVAYVIMRELGLGVTNAKLSTIAVGTVGGVKSMAVSPSVSGSEPQKPSVGTIAHCSDIRVVDGKFDVCLGATLTHRPSGVSAALQSVQDDKIVLRLSGLPGDNVVSLTVARNSTGQVGSQNGGQVTFAYMGLFTNGAYVEVKGIGQNPGLLPPTPVVSTVPKKYLTIMAVNSGAQSGFTQNSWERTMLFKENDSLQIFEVAIWDNGVVGNPSRVSLYKFDRTFDPTQERYADGGPDWVTYREGYNVKSIDIPSDCGSARRGQTACSTAYLNAFQGIFGTILQNQPAQHYAIKYGGHGSDVGLFGNLLSKGDTEHFLAYVKAAIGAKLAFLDWSTNCDMGTDKIVDNEYSYADYIITSDLTRGGFAADWAADYYRLKPEANMSRFFGPSKSIRQSLIEMADSERAFWERPVTRNDMINKRFKQSLSVYDTSKYPALKASVDLVNAPSGDVLNYIESKFPEQIQKFYDFRSHYVSNKDFFQWDADSNGFRKVP